MKISKILYISTRSLLNFFGFGQGNCLYYPTCSKTIEESVTTFLKDYQRLAFRAQRSGKMLYNMPTKFHALWHWGRSAKFINPRRASTWIDEDFMGKMRALGQACTSGSLSARITNKMMRKYLIALDLALRGEETWFFQGKNSMTYIG